MLAPTTNRTYSPLVRLTKNKQALAAARNAVLFDLDPLVVRDRVSGKVLKHLTMLSIGKSLEQYLQWRRTGIPMDQNNARVIITFNSLSKQVGLDPEKKSTFGEDAKKEILEEIKNRLDMWVSGAGPFRTVEVQLPEEYKKQGVKLLHQILSKRENQLPLDSVAAFYAVLSESAEDLSDIKANLRALIKLHPDTFQLGAGAATKVFRVKDAKGKETEVFIPGPSTTTTGDNATVERLTDRTRLLGFRDKAHFDRARTALGTKKPTIKQLRDWLETE